MFDSGSKLYAFKADVILVLNSVSALRAKYYGFAGDRAAFVENKIEELTRIWDAIHRNSKAMIDKAAAIGSAK